VAQNQLSRMDSIASKNGSRKNESAQQLSESQLAVLAPTVRTSDFLRWTLQARQFVFDFWRSGDEKHLFAFHRHLAAMRRRATEAAK